MEGQWTNFNYIVYSEHPHVTFGSVNESRASVYKAGRRVAPSHLFPPAPIALMLMVYNPFAHNDSMQQRQHQHQGQSLTPTVTTPGGASSNSSTPMMPFPPYDFDAPHHHHQAQPPQLPPQLQMSPNTTLHPAIFSPHGVYPPQEFPPPTEAAHPAESPRVIQLEEKQPLIHPRVTRSRSAAVGESCMADTRPSYGTRSSGAAGPSTGVSRQTRGHDRHHPYTRPQSPEDSRNTAGGKQSASRRVSVDSPMRFSPEEIGETVVASGALYSGSPHAVPGEYAPVASGGGSVGGSGISGPSGTSRMRYAGTTSIRSFTALFFLHRASVLCSFIVLIHSLAHPLLYQVWERQKRLPPTQPNPMLLHPSSIAFMPTYAVILKAQP
jgi:hypothetical protein